MGCKPYSNDLQAWFVSNHLIKEHDPESLRQYKTYLETGGHCIEGAAFEDVVPDKKMRDKITTYEVLK